MVRFVYRGGIWRNSEDEILKAGLYSILICTISIQYMICS